MADENSILVAWKNLDFEKQRRNSQNYVFHSTLCYGLDATKFRPKFRLKPKIILCFRFLLNRNRKHRNWFRFPFKGKGISAERKILAENFGFLCSLILVKDSLLDIIMSHVQSFDLGHLNQGRKLLNLVVRYPKFLQGLRDTFYTWIRVIIMNFMMQWNYSVGSTLCPLISTST